MMRAHFKRQIALRVLALFTALLATSLVIAYSDYRVTPLMLILVCVGLTAELMAYVQRTNRDITRFLNHIEFDDYAQRMPAAVEGAGFNELSEAMDRIIQRIAEQRHEQEQERRTLKSIIENVPSPLFSVRDDGVVTIHNHAARRFFAPDGIRSASQLAAWGPELWRAIEDQAPGRSRVIRVQVGDDTPTRMALSLADIVVGGQRQHLVSLQNISSDLDASELEAWEQMARVLAHEIMNSLTPVASLAGTARELLKADEEAAQRKAAEAIDTVAKRADSLMEFVQSYRRFSRLPEPAMATVELKPLLKRVIQLSSAETAAENIDWALDVEPQTLTLQADSDQLEQVLINLVSNAIQAVRQKPDPAIHINARINRDSRTVVEVKDNGPGVPQDRREQIFVPYFSTRRGGTGVGLALTRQVMSAHGGSVSVSDNPGGGSVFRLQF